ncbi:MAG: hypothetical protein H6993_10205 [Pseudomonadales bacterium]|nr:hypothetical protein [Pseudomonadales bacterium]
MRHLLPAVFLIAAGTANAAWHGNLKWMSEYAYRGYSMSEGKPAIQGNLEYVAESGWYGGLSVSGEDLDSGAGNGTSSWVVIPRVGRQWRIDDDWQTETWIAAYRHEGKIEGKRANYAEITTAVHFRDLFTARLSFAPDAYGRSPDLLSVEFGAAYDLYPNLQTSGGIGYSASTEASNLEQGYWHASLSWFLTPNLVADLRYTDTFAVSYDAADEDSGRFYLEEQQHRFVLTVTFGF